MFITITSYLCLGLIAVVNFFYLIFGARFAEINIQLAFLDFPIFIGEWLMFFCMIIFLIQILIRKMYWKGWRIWIWILFYFIWVMIKTVEGYGVGGGYALRNAALFYYPVFAVLVGYFLRNTRSVSNKWLILLSALFLTITAIISMEIVLFIASLYVIAGISHPRVRWTLMGALIFSFFLRIGVLSSGRGCLMGILIGVFFLMWYGAQIFRVSFWKQIAAVFILSVMLFASLWLWGDRHAFISLITPSKIIEAYHRNNKIVNENRDMFVLSQLEPQVYHPNGQVSKRQGQPLLSNEKKYTEKQTDLIQPAVEPIVDGKVPQDLKRDFRPLGIAYENIIFRLFIWRDMFQELLHHRPVFGLSFGKPQRSISIEILNWAPMEWSRDGWITMHNSFLHFVYRGGIVGLVMIGGIIFSVIAMTKDFFRARSWQGGLLIAALIYWIVIAQFGVILELPYHAIPFWSWFGLTVAKRQYLRNIPKKESML